MCNRRLIQSDAGWAYSALGGGGGKKGVGIFVGGAGGTEKKRFL